MKKSFLLLLLIGFSALSAGKKYIPIRNHSKACCLVRLGNGSQFFIQPNTTEKVLAGKTITITPYKKGNKQTISTEIPPKDSKNGITITNAYAIPDTIYRTGFWYILSIEIEKKQ